MTPPGYFNVKVSGGMLCYSVSNWMAFLKNIVSHPINLGWGEEMLFFCAFFFFLLSAHSLQAQVITTEACTSLPMLNCLEA